MTRMLRPWIKEVLHRQNTNFSGVKFVQSPLVLTRAVPGVHEDPLCSGMRIRMCSSASVDPSRADDPDMPVQMENPYKKEPRLCVLCKHKIKVDYKNTKLLSQFVSPYTGFIYDKHITGLCDKQQQIVKTEIRKAQSFGFMPFVMKEPRFLKDPKLFDPARPQRPHPY